MNVTKPYKYIGFGAMDVTTPYKFIGLGAMDVTRPYRLPGAHPDRRHPELTPVPDDF